MVTNDNVDRLKNLPTVLSSKLDRGAIEDRIRKRVTEWRALSEKSDQNFMTDSDLGRAADRLAPILQNLWQRAEGVPERFIGEVELWFVRNPTDRELSFWLNVNTDSGSSWTPNPVEREHFSGHFRNHCSRSRSTSVEGKWLIPRCQLGVYRGKYSKEVLDKRTLLMSRLIAYGFRVYRSRNMIVILTKFSGNSHINGRRLPLKDI